MNESVNRVKQSSDGGVQVVVRCGDDDVICTRSQAQKRLDCAFYGVGSVENTAHNAPYKDWRQHDKLMKMIGNERGVLTYSGDMVCLRGLQASHWLPFNMSPT